jgi:hypothetical protein
LKDYAETWRVIQVRRPSTAAAAETYLGRHVYPYLGDLRVRAIRRSHVQTMVKALIEELASASVVPAHRWTEPRAERVRPQRHEQRLASVEGRVGRDLLGSRSGVRDPSTQSEDGAVPHVFAVPEVSPVRVVAVGVVVPIVDLGEATPMSRSGAW